MHCKIPLLSTYQSVISYALSYFAGIFNNKHIPKSHSLKSPKKTKSKECSFTTV